MGGACSDWRPAVSGSQWLVGKPRSQLEVRQASVIVWTTTEWPEVLAVGLGDGQVVDARVAAPHEPVAFELPVFVAVRAEPVTAVVVPLVREANGDAIAAHRPELLDEAVVQLSSPFAPQELHDLLTSSYPLGAIEPHAVDRVARRHSFRITAVTGVLGEPYFLDCRVPVKRR